MKCRSLWLQVEYAGSIQHPNIVKLLGYFTHGPYVVLVWELIRGLDLLDKLNECGGRLEEPKAALYFSQLLQAVHHVHANGMCHRDLKPGGCVQQQALSGRHGCFWASSCTCHPPRHGLDLLQRRQAQVVRGLCKKAAATGLRSAVVG